MLGRVHASFDLPVGCLPNIRAKDFTIVEVNFALDDEGFVGIS